MFSTPQTPEKVLKELHIQLWHKGLFHTKEEDTCLIILAVGQQEKPPCPCPQLWLGTRSCTVPAALLALPGAGFLSAAGLRQCERGIHSAVQSLEVPDVSTQWSALPAAQGPHDAVGQSPDGEQRGVRAAVLAAGLWGHGEGAGVA